MRKKSTKKDEVVLVIQQARRLGLAQPDSLVFWSPHKIVGRVRSYSAATDTAEVEFDRDVVKRVLHILEQRGINAYRRR